MKKFKIEWIATDLSVPIGKTNIEPRGKYGFLARSFINPAGNIADFEQLEGLRVENGVA